MTSQARWFSFGAAAGLPVALLASQLHWVAGFNVAVADSMVLPQHSERSERAEGVVTVNP